MAGITPGQGARGRALRKLTFRLDNRAHEIKLGPLTWQQARAVADHVEHLIAAKKSGAAIPPRTAEWLAETDLREKLVSKGLCDPVAGSDSVPTLGDAAVAFLEEKHFKSAGNERNHTQGLTYLVEHFGPRRAADDISVGEGVAWFEWLQKGRPEGPGLAEATSKTYAVCASAMFERLIDHDIIAKNPMRKVPKGVVVRHKPIVAAELVERVAAKLPPEPALALMLARYLPLRMPSEGKSLRWERIDWSNNTIDVWTQKLRTWRTVPLWNEVRPLLEARRRDEGAILPSLGAYAETWLASYIKRACRKAGVKPWRSITQSLRASRETELLNQGHRLDVVAYVCGHTPATALKHYATHQAVEATKLAKQIAALANPEIGIQIGIHNRTQQAH